MGFLELQFPTGVAYGTRGGPAWRNSVIELDSGASERIQRWSQPRRMYDAKWGIRDLDDFQDVRDLWMQTKGSMHGFRFRDPMDYTTRPVKPNKHTGAYANDDVVIGIGDGVETQFQLIKRYSFGGEEHTWTIRKPVAGKVSVAFDGVNQSSGWSVNTTTGVITFTTAPANTVVVTAGCEYDVPVQFTPEMDGAFDPILGSFNAAELPSIRMAEMIGDVTTQVRRNHGGGSSQTIEATTEVHFGMGSAITLDPKAAHTILMPSAATLDLGLDYFVFWNRTTFGSYSLTFKTYDGATTLWTAAADKKFECFVYDNLGTNQWGAVGV